jgi:hypothetical protein
MNNNRGFIMLAMTLILSAIAVVAVLDQSEHVASFQSINDEVIYKESSLDLARACRNKALLDVALDPSTNIDGTIVDVASSTCEIVSATSSSTEVNDAYQMQIETSATVNRSDSFLLMTADMTDTGLTLEHSYDVSGF